MEDLEAPIGDDEQADQPRSRRQLLRLAGAAAAGGAGLVIANASPAAAADEGALLMGNTNNNSGGDLTSLNGPSIASLSIGVSGLSDDTTALSAASVENTDLKLNGTGRLGMTASLSGNAQPSYDPLLNDLVKSTSGALWSGTGALFDT